MTTVVIFKKLDEMRENRRMLAETILVVGCIMTLVISTISAMQSPRSVPLGSVESAEVLVAVFVASLFFAGIPIILASQMVKETMLDEKNAFRSYFGREYPQGSKEIRIMQCAVDERLVRLAHAFRDACTAEEVFLINTALLKTAEVETARKQLKELRFKIGCTKQEFWRARSTAKLFGFKVWPTSRITGPCHGSISFSGAAHVVAPFTY